MSSILANGSVQSTQNGILFYDSATNAWDSLTGSACGKALLYLPVANSGDSLAWGQTSDAMNKSPLAW